MAMQWKITGFIPVLYSKNFFRELIRSIDSVLLHSAGLYRVALYSHLSNQLRQRIDQGIDRAIRKMSQHPAITLFEYPGEVLL